MSSTSLGQLCAIALNFLHNINPQLLREWQGRLRWSSVTGALIVSAVIQFPALVMAVAAEERTWAATGENLYHDLSLVLTWALIIVGVFMLAADISKEHKRGTLNFVRMAPAPASRIFLGKLLGVPILLYIGLLAMLPLHFIAGIIAKLSLLTILVSYLHLVIVAVCFFAVSMWFALFANGLKGLQPWIAAIASMAYLLPLQHYFFIPIYQNGKNVREVLFSLVLGFGVLIASLFWIMLVRQFKTPERSALGKKQSYVLTLCFAILLAAIAVSPLLSGMEEADKSLLFFRVYLPIMLSAATLLLLLLLPSKQAMLNWMRDYPQSEPGSVVNNFAADNSRAVLPESSHSSLFRTLVFQDNSPPPLALAVNLLIMAGVLTVAGVWLSFDGLTAWLWQLYVCSASLLIYAMLIQHIIFSGLRNRPFVPISAIAVLIGGWPLLLAFLKIPAHQTWLSWLWRTTLFYQPMESGIFLSEVIVAIAAHFILLYSLSVSLPNKIINLSADELRRLP